MTDSTIDALRLIERRLRHLTRRIGAATEENARAIDPRLQANTFRMLRFVADHQPTRAAEVAEAFGIDKGAVSRGLATLQEMGLVRRACDPDDRRVQTVELTGDGAALVQQATERRRRIAAHRLAQWSPDDLAAFADHLARFDQAMDDR